VAGLPGETVQGLLDSLTVVAGLKPHVIQIEPLKVLKGAPMRTIAKREGYRFSDSPPYTILSTPWLSFDDVGRIETIGRLLDLFYNQGEFDTALQLMQRTLGIADLFDRMAQRTAAEALTGRSTRRVYELFAELAGVLLPEDERQLLFDALFFDYCRCEMPLLGKLPAFVADRQKECAWPGRKELPEGLDLPDDNRVKAFRFVFERDYRTDEWEDGPASVTFVYSSGAGKGLRVIVM
jgi:anaerobic magnesium-protoporphyrin IX monomethyl ester cyclase